MFAFCLVDLHEVLSRGDRPVVPRDGVFVPTERGKRRSALCAAPSVTVLTPLRLSGSLKRAAERAGHRDEDASSDKTGDQIADPTAAERDAEEAH